MGLERLHVGRGNWTFCRVSSTKVTVQRTPQNRGVTSVSGVGYSSKGGREDKFPVPVWTVFSILTEFKEHQNLRSVGLGVLTIGSRPERPVK